jgi:GNAT superfamily N-acetyltransferase
MPWGWLGDDLYAGLLERYVRRVYVDDPDALEALSGRPALFLANHQVQIESLLVTTLLAALHDTNVVTMANAKHRERWVGWMVHQIFGHPDCHDPENIVYFEQEDRGSMFRLVESLEQRVRSEGCSIMVHAAGTRERSCRDRTERVSSILIDLALDLELPIVPVHFAGGLPVEPVDDKLEFPVGHGSQDYRLGAPITPDELAELHYAARRDRILEAIESLGPDPDDCGPLPPDPSFAAAVEARHEQWSCGLVEAALFETLRAREEQGEDTERIVRAADGGALTVADDPQGRWLGEVAGRLFGPGGPSVTVES